MKIITVLLNIISLCFIGYMLNKNGMPNNDEIFLVLILVSANVTALITILKFKDNTLLGLYIQRKMLEEQKKIEILNTNKNP